MKHMYIFLISSVLLVVAFLVFVVAPQMTSKKSAVYTEKVFLGGNEFTVELAKNPISQAKGLSGHAPLGEREGMLFIFPMAWSYGFWMKDMLYPIDIIWIKDNRVVGAELNAPPDDSGSRKVYYPPEPVNMVLEVAAGTTAKFGILPNTEFRRASEK